MKYFVLLTTLIFHLHVEGGLLPDYDYNCDSMKAHKCPIEEVFANRSKLTERVPRIIHRIWLGDQSKLSLENRKIWEDYAKQFGYQYILWGNENDSSIRTFMKAENFSLYKQMIHSQDWWCASDVLRLELLKKFGGIYIDCDFLPPQYQGEFIDLDKVFPMTGLNLITEHFARDIGSETAIFIANGFVCAPPNHPVICSCANQINDNFVSFKNKKGYHDAMYSTGPFLLNKVLNGPFTVVPIRYIHELKMYE